jgi:hypothetical protein
MRPFLYLIAGFLILTACNTALSEEQIKEEIVKANYCQTTDDCVDVGGKCPFGCYIFVNKDEAATIRPLVENYPSQCEYSCIAISGVQCIDNACRPVHEAPPLDEEAAKGNVGAACTTDSECVTPMDYLIRSVCPYTSLCVDGSCAVACTMLQHGTISTPGETVPPDTQFTVSCESDADCECGAYGPGRIESCSCVHGTCAAIVDR